MPTARIALAVALATACADQPPGRKLASGIASRIAVHEGHAAFLVDAVHPDDRTIPEDLVTGDLWLDDHKVGAGVSSQPGMYAFSPKGELAFLASWRFRAGEGELWKGSTQVAKVARTFAWSPDGSTLAYVAPNRLGVGEKEIAIEGVQEIAWAPDGRRLAARTSAAAGGKLYLVENLSPREIAPGTSDFAFAPNGALAALGPPPPKGGDRPLLLDGKEIARATAFAFSPDGTQIALLSTSKQPGEATGDLYRLRAGKQELIATKVSDWRWEKGGDLLCLSRYDLRARAGTLVANGREIGQKVQSFVVFGRKLTYLVQAPQKGDFKIELWGVDLADEKTPPHRIDEGVYGWDLVGDALFYKARCAGGSRSCQLFRTTFAAAGKPEVLASNVAGFDLSRDGTRILVQQPHRGAARAVDLAVIPVTGGQVRPFVEEVDQSSKFIDAAGKRVVYALSRGGVYVVDVP